MALLISLLFCNTAPSLVNYTIKKKSVCISSFIVVFWYIQQWPYSKILEFWNSGIIEQLEAKNRYTFEDEGGGERV